MKSNATMQRQRKLLQFVEVFPSRRCVLFPAGFSRPAVGTSSRTTATINISNNYKVKTSCNEWKNLVNYKNGKVKNIHHTVPTAKQFTFLSFYSFFSHPQSEGWPHHGRTFSIYLCPLSFWLTLPRGVLSTYWCCPSRPCVVFPTMSARGTVPCIISFSRQLTCFLMV